MPTDAERFRFISKFRLHVSWHSDQVTLMGQQKVQHWEASPPDFEVASRKTLEKATDSAIERYNRNHGITQREPAEPFGVRGLQLRGSVS
jgi:hypothetical protein